MIDSPTLQTLLTPLSDWLHDDAVQEISINRPGEIWVDRGTADRYQCHKHPALTLEYLSQLAALLATANGQRLNKGSPLLSGTLPDGTRIQVVIPPAAADESIIMSFRRHKLLDETLNELTRRGMFDATVTHGNADVTQPAEYLRQAVREHKTILLCGSTGAGKTTLANALIKEIPADERLCIIEDSHELAPTNPNTVRLLYARGDGISEHGARHLFESALRLHPDRIICGELRGVEAAMWLELINTDHPGSITTLHANGAEQAVNRIALLALQANLNLSFDDVRQYVRGLIDVYVQVTRRTDGLRHVSAINIAK